MRARLADIWRRLRGSRATRLEGPFASYAEARALCGAGYENPELANVVATKTIALRELLQRQAPDLDIGTTRLIAATMLERDAAGHALTILDHGGGCGAHFFCARAVVDESVDMRWFVVETHAMTSVAQHACAAPGLHFVESAGLTTALDGPVDVACAIRSVNYSPDPLAVIRNLLQAHPSSLLITGLTVTNEARQLFYVQTTHIKHHGPGPAPAGMADSVQRIPVAVPPRADVRALLGDQYRIVAEFRDQPMHIAEGLSDFSFLCRRG